MGGRMSGRRWDQLGVPHKAGQCVDVVDLRADGEPADEASDGITGWIRKQAV